MENNSSKQMKSAFGRCLLTCSLPPYIPAQDPTFPCRKWGRSKPTPAAPRGSEATCFPGALSPSRALAPHLSTLLPSLPHQSVPRLQEEAAVSQLCSFIFERAMFSILGLVLLTLWL